VLRGHEAAPIVVGDTMYVGTPYPNLVYALDLTHGDARVRWKYDRKPEAFAQGVACCDVVNRGVAYADNKCSGLSYLIAGLVIVRAWLASPARSATAPAALASARARR
jgi:glucose dehydrogenase